MEFGRVGDLGWRGRSGTSPEVRGEDDGERGKHRKGGEGNLWWEWVVG